MTRTDLSAAGRAWRSYRGSGVGTMAFLAARLANAPLGGLDAPFRRLSGRVLSLGSGHGILERYLTEINAGVTVEGFELDGDRVRAAARTQERAPRVVLHEQDVRTLGEPGTFDAAILVDVMHHIPYDAQEGVLASVARALRPGGTCLLKDIATAPAWKHRFNATHDRLVAGEVTQCRAPADMARLAERAGFEVRATRRLDRVSPYPHYLLELARA